MFNFKSSARIIVAKGRRWGKRHFYFALDIVALRKLFLQPAAEIPATRFRDANFALMADIDRYDDVVHGSSTAAIILFLTKRTTAFENKVASGRLHFFINRLCFFTYHFLYYSVWIGICVFSYFILFIFSPHVFRGPEGEQGMAILRPILCLGTLWDSLFEERKD